MSPVVLLLGISLFGTPAVVRAATFTVSSTGDSGTDLTTLRGAIAGSEASADANDIINITATGTITLSPSSGPLAIYNGQSVAGKTLTITGPGAARLTVNGGGQTGDFAISDNGTGSLTVNLSGLTVSNGANNSAGAGINTNQPLNLSNVVLSGNTATDGIGGGLYALGVSVALTDCTVSGNSAVEGPGAMATTGGGLYVDGGTLTLTRCTVSNNSSDDFVGGIENNFGTLTVTDSTISGNTAGVENGGIENAGTATLTRCTISGNSGSYGGGLYSSGPLAMTACTISGNSSDWGGGVFSFADSVSDTSSVTTTFTDCTFSGNSASQEGGGFCSYGGASGTDSGPIATTFTDCTFSGNSASGDFGGGLYISSTDDASGNAPLSTTLTNCTISGNTAPTGGGGLDFYGSVSGAVGSPITPTCVVQSSIIAGNALNGMAPGPDADVHDDGQETLTSGGSNLIGTGNGDFINGTGHDQIGTGAASISPHLGALANNGGPTQTLALLAGSPALDANFNAPGSTDERGLPCPSGLRGDIGSFEHQRPVAAAYSFTTAEGVAKTVSAATLFANASAPDAVSAPTAAPVAGPAHGTLTWNPDGSFTYTPAAGFIGTDSLTYDINDGVMNSAPATVTATVQSTGQDVTPPVTTAALNPATPTGGSGYYRQPVTITLAATDDASGVAGTFYSVNGGGQQAYNGAFTLSADGAYTVSYHSVDAAGNAEVSKTLAIKIDATAPTLTFGTPTPTPNASGWNNTPVSVPATATDNLSGVASITPSPVRITTEGAKQAQSVTVTDTAGNSSESRTPSVNIDLTKPVTTATTQSAASGEQVTLSATDNLSGVAGTVYAIDGGAQTPYTTPFVVTGNGSHTVTFSSTDKAGNAEGTKTLSFTINIAAPVTTASVAGPLGSNAYYTGPVTVTLTAKSAASSVTTTSYSVDGGERTAYTGPFAVSGDKAHVVTYNSADAAGNTEAVHTLSLKIDGIAPVTTISVAGPQSASGPYTGAVTVTLAATDDFAGVAALTYSIDGGAAQTYTAPFSVGTAGDHKITYFSTDGAGNVEATRTLALTIQIATSTPAPTPAPAIAHTFPSGLQMFSVPADYSAVPLGTVLSQSNPKLAVWDPAMTQYVLSPNAPADALRPGQGYWVRFSQATDLYALGTPTPTDKPFTLSLKKGWNMIGDPFPGTVGLGAVQVQSGGQTYPSVDAAGKAGVTDVTLYSYPAGAGAYQTEDVGGSLVPYTGYWLYAFQDCTLSVSAP